MMKTRLLFVDNLRILLIALVITLHLSVTYGGEGSWYYKEGRADTLTSASLTLHNATAQSFFMGLLFLIAAYFTPGSYDRKGAGAFLRDRFLRLGVPLLFYEFIIQPFLAYPLLRADVLRLEGSFGQFLASYYTRFHIGSGPLWFVETLLIFTVLYAARRWIGQRTSEPYCHSGYLPDLKAILALALLLGVLTFIARLWFPVNWAFGPLNLQLAFFVQYVAMLVLGVIAYRRDWFVRLPRTLAGPCFALAGLLVVVGFPLLFILGGALAGDVSRFLGGPHWQAFAYAMWEQLLGLVMITGLLILFRERFNRQGALAKESAAASYTVYIIHPPLVVLLTLAVRGIQIYPLLKFALAAATTVPLCFLLAAGIRRLPLARNVL